MDNLEWLHKHTRKPFSLPQRDSFGTPQLTGAGDGGVGRDSHPTLRLVYQAAEVIRGLEERTKEFEIHARDLIEKATEKLAIAEKRIQNLEEQQQKAEVCLNEADARVLNAQEALQAERARLLAAENQLPELERRARSAETRADECEKLLARIEDAIRTEVLRQQPSTFHRSKVAA